MTNPQVDSDGTVTWYKNGKLHREDGPAIVTRSGSEHWYLNGKLHRAGAPAIISPSEGAEYWYQNGKQHREDGPATVMKHGTKLWYLDGEQLPFGNFCEKLQLTDVQVQELCTKFGMEPLNSLGTAPSVAEL